MITFFIELYIEIEERWKQVKRKYKFLSKLKRKDVEDGTKIQPSSGATKLKMRCDKGGKLGNDKRDYSQGYTHPVSKPNVCGKANNNDKPRRKSSKTRRNTTNTKHSRYEMRGTREPI